MTIGALCYLDEASMLRFGTATLTCEGPVTKLLCYHHWLQEFFIIHLSASHELLHFTIDVKGRPAQKLVMEEITIPSSSVLSEHGYMQHVAPSEVACVASAITTSWFQEYVQLKYGIDFSFDNSLAIASNDEDDQAKAENRVMG